MWAMACLRSRFLALHRLADAGVSSANRRSKRCGPSRKCAGPSPKVNIWIWRSKRATTLVSRRVYAHDTGQNGCALVGASSLRRRARRRCGRRISAMRWRASAFQPGWHSRYRTTSSAFGAIRRVTGKAAGNDILRRKKSLPILHGLNHDRVGNQLHENHFARRNQSRANLPATPGPV